MLHNFDSFLEESLKDPELKKEYDALEPEFSIIQDIMDAQREASVYSGSSIRGTRNV